MRYSVKLTMTTVQHLNLILSLDPENNFQLLLYLKWVVLGRGESLSTKHKCTQFDEAYEPSIKEKFPVGLFNTANSPFHTYTQ